MFLQLSAAWKRYANYPSVFRFRASVVTFSETASVWIAESSEEALLVLPGFPSSMSAEVFTRSAPWIHQVVREAKGRLPVFLDGGVRRGTDVFKALALGASGVFVRTTHPLATANTVTFVQARHVTLLLGAADRPAGAVLAGSGRRGRRAEGAADAEGRAGAHHGAQRLHVAQGDHPRPRHHRQRQDRPLAAVECTVQLSMLVSTELS